MLADAEWRMRAKAALLAAVARGNVWALTWYLTNDIEDFPDYLKERLKVPYGETIH